MYGTSWDSVILWRTFVPTFWFCTKRTYARSYRLTNLMNLWLDRFIRIGRKLVVKFHQTDPKCTLTAVVDVSSTSVLFFNTSWRVTQKKHLVIRHAQYKGNVKPKEAKTWVFLFCFVLFFLVCFICLFVCLFVCLFPTCFLHIVPVSNYSHVHWGVLTTHNRSHLLYVFYFCGVFFQTKIFVWCEQWLFERLSWCCNLSVFIRVAAKHT